MKSLTYHRFLFTQNTHLNQLTIQTTSSCPHRTARHSLRRRRLKAQAKPITKEGIYQTPVFVDCFRQASPYIVEHADSLFVIVIPGEVASREKQFYQVLSDLRLLHSLGIHLVLVTGSSHLLDEYLCKFLTTSQFHNGIRVTTPIALEGAIHVSSILRAKIEGFFSTTPSVPLMRRHGTKGSGVMGAKVISGNFIAAKPLGIISGVNFRSTGTVRFVLHESIKEQLKTRNIVLLSNLGYGANGDILNCNSYEIGLHAAVQLKADKLICLHDSDPNISFLPNWVPLDDALNKIPERIRAQILQEDSQSSLSRNSISERLNSGFELLQRASMPPGFSLCILSCLYGVQRTHLVDACMDGALLSELYTRDGLGQMISTDFHEGIRPAVPGDITGITQLLKPLEESGITVRRSYAELQHEVQNFRVFEKERRILGCALVKILKGNGHQLAELAALCIHPDIRRQGKGDALLTYIENELARQDVQMLIILTTRTAEWFVQRGFELAGPAHESNLLPKFRSQQINTERNSQLYYKRLVLEDH